MVVVVVVVTPAVFVPRCHVHNARRDVTAHARQHLSPDATSSNRPHTTFSESHIALADFVRRYTLMGISVAVTVAFEIPMFALSDRILARASPPTLLLLAHVAYVVRCRCFPRFFFWHVSRFVH